MKSFLSIFLFLISSVCLADEAFSSYGIGVFGDADYHMAQMKVGELGYRDFLFGGIYWQHKVGYWGEGSPDPSRKSSFFVSSGPGMEVDLQPIEIRSGWGLAAISNPDSQLGGRFPQFNGELYLGLRDRKGDGIGIEYEHVSSAGIVTPNHGRDAILLQLSQKW